VSEIRNDFDALSKRITALGNAGPAFSLEQIQPLLKQAIAEALQAGGPGPDAMDHLPGPHEGGTPIVPPEPTEGQEGATEPAPEGDSLPNVPGSRLAPDGQHYINDPNRSGKFLQVMGNA